MQRAKPARRHRWRRTCCRLSRTICHHSRKPARDPTPNPKKHHPKQKRKKNKTKPRGVARSPHGRRDHRRELARLRACAWPTLTEKQGKNGKPEPRDQGRESEPQSHRNHPPDKRREQPRIRIKQTAQQRGSYRLPAKVLANRPGIAAKEAKIAKERS